MSAQRDIRGKITSVLARLPAFSTQAPPARLPACCLSWAWLCVHLQCPHMSPAGALRLPRVHPRAKQVWRYRGTCCNAQVVLKMRQQDVRPLLALSLPSSACSHPLISCLCSHPPWISSLSNSPAPACRCYARRITAQTQAVPRQAAPR